MRMRRRLAHLNGILLLVLELAGRVGGAEGGRRRQRRVERRHARRRAHVCRARQVLSGKSQIPERWHFGLSQRAKVRTRLPRFATASTYSERGGFG